jgi:hypothetical protein
VGAADQHLVSNHAIKQLAPANFGQYSVLVEYPVPPRMRGAQRRHVGGITGNHQLFIARAYVEGGVAGRVSGCADETDSGHHLVFALHREHVLPLRDDDLNAAGQRPAPWR